MRLKRDFNRGSARPYCKKTFTPEYGNKKRLFCSLICSKKYSLSKRPARNHEARAKYFGVKRTYFNVLRIFERDKWRCQLCGISTPKRLKGKNKPNSPELDHIIPLSMGGNHVVENVQCACRNCNSAKSNKPLGQQWLIGFADPIKRKQIKHIANPAKILGAFPFVNRAAVKRRVRS